MECDAQNSSSRLPWRVAPLRNQCTSIRTKARSRDPCSSRTIRHPCDYHEHFPSPPTNVYRLALVELSALPTLRCFLIPATQAEESRRRSEKIAELRCRS